MLDRNPHAWLVIKLRMFIELDALKAIVVGNKSEKDHMNMYLYLYVFEIL